MRGVQESTQQPLIQYRPDIDGLRAVAVLAVLVFHAFPEALPGGFVGVDIFFVISGFLISGIILKDLDRGRFTFANFYSRRVRRIFPSLVLVLALVLAIGWFLLLPNEFVALSSTPQPARHSYRTWRCGVNRVTSILRPNPSLCCIFGRWVSRSSTTLSGPCYWHFSGGVPRLSCAMSVSWP